MNLKPKKLLLIIHHSSLFTLLALPLLLGAKADTANDRMLCTEGFLKIVSPDPVSVDQCRQVAKMTMDAWNFDLKQNNWSRSINMYKPLKFRLLSTERMNAEHHGLIGMAFAPGDRFIASTAVLDNPFAKRTLAHELGHIQSYRALGYQLRPKVPPYFFEAHGNSMGLAYRDYLGLPVAPYDKGNAKMVANLTAQEARRILTTGRDYFMINGKRDLKKNGTMEALSVFFVEYLRVRKGITDAVPRLARVFELVGGGMKYKQAFQQVYGISVDQAVSDITAFMARTESSPKERLKGTRYGGLAR